jgi:peptide deformylase
LRETPADQAQIVSVAQLVAYPDDRLRQISRPYAFDGCGDSALKHLLLTMRETMYDGMGWGLSAIQIGVPVRVFVVHVPLESAVPLVFVNPEIVGYSNEVCELNEGCLSFQGIVESLQRPARVVIKRMNEFNRHDQCEFDGWTARAIQHEMDHLDGKVFTDRLMPIARKALERQLRLRAERSAKRKASRHPQRDSPAEEKEFA